jgi:hypothetical protein
MIESGLNLRSDRRVLHSISMESEKNKRGDNGDQGVGRYQAQIGVEFITKLFILMFACLIASLAIFMIENLIRIFVLSGHKFIYL